MIRVTVSFSAQLRTATAVAAQTLEVEEGTTIRAVVGRLAAAHGEEFRALLLRENDDLRPSTLVFLDGEQVRDDTRELAEGSDLHLTTPIAGG